MAVGIGDLTRVALVFPGQGSHEDGMRGVVAEWRPSLLETLAEATESDCFADAESSTAACQPAIVAVSIAYWHALGRPTAGFVTGHSLGELTALVAAGSLDEHDAVRLAARRGALMQAASDEHPGCGMMAVKAQLDEIEAIAHECGVVVGNHNGRRQVVLSGGAEELERARLRLREERVRCTVLRVAGAFHSPLMASAVEPFRAALREVRFREPRSVVFSGISARPMTDPASELADSLLHPVRWVETIEAIAGEGAERFVEVGPSQVLQRLVNAIVGSPEPKSDEDLTVHARALLATR
ncbi:MAG TPA: ACP S-malonyltransferase [Thermoleophilaceae bacterium]|jgi:[acyl-carrier-protein] S-malonyltransferase